MTSSHSRSSHCANKVLGCSLCVKWVWVENGTVMSKWVADIDQEE